MNGTSQRGFLGKRGWFAAVSLVAFLAALPAASRIGSGEPSRTEQVSNAVTEIDLVRAEQLLARTEAESAGLAYERARLAIYRGDCDVASVTLSSPELSETREGQSLKELADSCARATVAGFVIEDEPRGIWLRVQDDADRALAPFIFDVAARARASVCRSVGTDLPRPLRIDLVRDLFSLSAVSGLPLSAAETTGTLAVARWGRVILLSPRAAALGFPWEDTLAHEITHLVVTRATRDHAPLWLQEGMAKRLESSWRSERPFDEPGWADELAYRALLEGRAIGIDKLGPSIAMLPTPEAASIAFAEVTSFVGYFAKEAGAPALRLLFADLRGSGQQGADVALRSVTGYTLSEWNARWQRALKPPGAPALSPLGPAQRTSGVKDLSRRVRLSDLLSDRAHAAAAADLLQPAISAAHKEPSLRWRAARALLEAGDVPRARVALGAQTEIGGVHGAWYALHGRLLREAGEAAAAEEAFQLGIAVDPLSEEVACEGRRVLPGESANVSILPEKAERRELCRAARERPRN